MAIISNIEELAKTVKVSASMPWEVVEPFLQSARDIYLTRYLSTTMVELMEAEVPEARFDELRPLVQKALGPLAMWMGNAELSVRISDSGFTVEKNQERFLPASDTKIAKVEESLRTRGFHYLDKALEYLEANAATFEEWTSSQFYTLRGRNYIRTAVQFQELGLVYIDYSRLGFEALRPLMTIVEDRYITQLMGETLDATLRASIDAPEAAEPQKLLVSAIRQLVACKVAELHTNQPPTAKHPDYVPVIRPVFNANTDAKNFFAEQADFYTTRIRQLMIKHATELGIEAEIPAMNWNSTENSFFCDIG